MVAGGEEPFECISNPCTTHPGSGRLPVDLGEVRASLRTRHGARSTAAMALEPAPAIAFLPPRRTGRWSPTQPVPHGMRDDRLTVARGSGSARTHQPGVCVVVHD